MILCKNGRVYVPDKLMYTGRRKKRMLIYNHVKCKIEQKSIGVKRYQT